MSFHSTKSVTSFISPIYRKDDEQVDDSSSAVDIIIPSDAQVYAWAAELTEDLYRYDFNMINQDKPIKKTQIAIKSVTLNLETNSIFVTTLSENERTYELNVMSGDKHTAWGVFTSDKEAVVAAKRHFNQEKAQQLDDLRAQKADLEKQIKELEDELS